MFNGERERARARTDSILHQKNYLEKNYLMNVDTDNNVLIIIIKLHCNYVI